MHLHCPKQLLVRYLSACLLFLSTELAAVSENESLREGDILGDHQVELSAVDRETEEAIEQLAQDNARAYLEIFAPDTVRNMTHHQVAVRPLSPSEIETSTGSEAIMGYTSEAAGFMEDVYFRGRYNRSRARRPENIDAWRSEPNISNPGADLANFPNSAFTLPQGRAYIETSPLTYYGQSTGQPAQFNAEFLLRYGVTDNIEARIFGNGLSWQGGRHPDTGFSPIAFDTKIHLLDENEEWSLPAVGFEGYIQTTFLGNNPFLQGTTPGFTLNFDQSLPFDIDFEYNFGAVQQYQSTTGQKSWQFSFQWAFQRDLLDKYVAVFIHGFYNAMTLPRLPDSGGQPVGNYVPNQNAVGLGMIWTPNNRVSLWAQSALGTIQYSPANLSNIGFAIAF